MKLFSLSSDQNVTALMRITQSLRRKRPKTEIHKIMRIIIKEETVIKLKLYVIP